MRSRTYRAGWLAGGVAVLAAVTAVRAQEAPASPATMPASLTQPSGMVLPGMEHPNRLRSWELPPVTVEGVKPELKEEERVGSYEQPRWTATRRFTNSRVYVLPEGKMDAEYWLIPRFNKDGTTDIRSLYEIEFGLPNRLQLDLYFRTDQTTNNNDILLAGQFEVRYAFADWGVLPGNPALYLEYIWMEERPDRIEPKLLFGGELAPRWHWGANLVWEQELSGPEGETELELTSGISYSVIDSCLGIGAESVVHFGNTRETRSSWETQVLVGPSIQWKPVPPMYINFSPLFGVTDQSPDARLYLNVGWEF